MGADKSAENTPKFFGPICLPKSKSLGFSEKNFLWVSVVCGFDLKMMVKSYASTFFSIGSVLDLPANQQLAFPERAKLAVLISW